MIKFLPWKHGFDTSVYKYRKHDIADIIYNLGKDLSLDSYSIRYVIQRFKNEGWTFIAKTLPKLEQVLYQSLELGFFPRSDVTNFAYSGKTLKLFARLFRKIYDKKGFVKPNYCKLAFMSIVQFCGYWYKVCTPYSQSVEQLSVAKFLEIDKKIEKVNKRYFSKEKYATNFRKSLYHFTRSFYDSAVPSWDSVLGVSKPRFGPGTYAGKSDFDPAMLGLTNRESDMWWLRKHPIKDVFHVTKDELPYLGAFEVLKWRNKPPQEPLSSGMFPEFKKDIKDPLLPYETYSTNSLPARPVFRPVLVDEDTAPHSELLLVPKNTKGPRTIVREPAHRLRMQMAFFDYHSDYMEWRSGGNIQFTDQSRNKELARISSITGENATIDLSSASDSVSYRIIADLFRDINSVSVPIRKFRSTKCKLPNQGGLLSLNKLAGMGSGFTFPMLSYLCYASVCVSVHLETGESFSSIRPKVYTYGDDLIVPTEWIDFALKGLETVGFSINKDKSFVGTLNSKFRESCGGNYANGEDITITRLRQSAGTARDFPKPTMLSHLIETNKGVDSAFCGGLLQLERHCRQLVLAGLYFTANEYYKLIEKLIGDFLLPRSERDIRDGNPPPIYKLPIATGVFPGLCRYVPEVLYNFEYDRFGRYNEHRVLVPSTKLAKDVISGEDPYMYEVLERLELADALSKSDDAQKREALSILFADERGSGITIPNSLGLVWRKVSTIKCLAQPT